MNALFKRLALVPEPNERPATIWQQSQFAGAQSNLNIGAMQAIRATDRLQLTGSSFDRHMAAIAIRTCREALAEMERLLPPEGRMMGSPGISSAVCGVAKAPCKSCPYRQDVPSGVWHDDEYAKLPRFDGEIIDQLQAGAIGLFMCHQKDGRLCAGWLASHGPHNLLALRVRGHEVTPDVWSYESPVPVFASGAEAAAHGRAEIPAPSPRAARTISRLLQARLKSPKTPTQEPSDEQH